MNNTAVILIAGAVVLAFILFLILMFTVVRHWIKALLSGVSISILELIGMRLRGNPVDMLVNTLIVLLHTHNVKMKATELELIYLQFKPDIYSENDLLEVALKKLLDSN